MQTRVVERVANINKVTGFFFGGLFHNGVTRCWSQIKDVYCVIIFPTLSWPLVGRPKTYDVRFTLKLHRRRPVWNNRVAALDIAASVTQRVVRGIADVGPLRRRSLRASPRLPLHAWPPITDERQNMTGLMKGRLNDEWKWFSAWYRRDADVMWRPAVRRRRRCHNRHRSRFRLPPTGLRLQAQVTTTAHYGVLARELKFFQKYFIGLLQLRDIF